jgi:hypothetical protein
MSIRSTDRAHADSFRAAGGASGMLPNPLHGWRAFAGEVGIIVLGVLIALGAEQLVQGVHQRYLARQALGHIRGELAYDSAFAAERIAIGDCMRASFTDLRQRLAAAATTGPA